MERLFDFSKRLSQRSFFRYFVVGGTTFALDLALLFILHGILGVNLLVAATVSYWTSIIFNFLVNRIWTFGNKEHNTVAQNAALYLLLLVFNYLFSLGFIWGAAHIGMHYMIAKILATGLQVAWTYFAYKRVVFR